jgi:hypothetical protein
MFKECRRFKVYREIKSRINDIFQQGAASRRGIAAAAYFGSQDCEGFWGSVSGFEDFSNSVKFKRQEVSQM